MAIYHPPKPITNNQAPMLSADLMYEDHGKCGCETVILSDVAGGRTIWNTAAPILSIDGCLESTHAWKVVALRDTIIRQVAATNLSLTSTTGLITSFTFQAGTEIMADFTYFHLLTGMVILYMDGAQS
jgi:hypothetical protein